MVKILDGGMGGELIKRGHAQRSGLWSAQALLDAPAAVVQLHREYIDAGADIITTNTYSTVPSYLEKGGLAHRFAELTAQAAGLAREAASGSDVLVAGALPPLSESYRPDLVPQDEVARPLYAELAAALEPFVDLFFCETMSCARESFNAASAAIQAGSRGRQQPVYVSWTLDDEPGTGLRSCESIADAVAALSDLEIAGFLVNCARPECIAIALSDLRKVTGVPIGCYANRMESVPEGWTLDNEIRIAYRDDLSAALFSQWGRRSVAAGASIVGGCCGIGPSDIAALSRAIR